VLEYPDLHIKQNTQFSTHNEGVIFHSSEAFILESSSVLPELHLAYSTYGRFDPKANNVIWVCHALTGNSNVLDWWSELFGAGKFYDPEKYFVVCVNVIGSCYGSTGPLEINKNTGKPFFADFPEITIRDVVNSFELLRKYLGINKIHTCIGGSLGGQQSLEWAASNPELIENLVLMATNARTSSWGIALNETQRMAIRTDKTWGQPFAEAGEEGMKVARAIALLSYRSYQTYQETQKDDIDALSNYKAVSYQVYQGEKFGKRFNAYSYWALTVILDSHNIGRKRGSVEKALASIKAKTLIIGISSDVLFPVIEQEFIAKHISKSHFEVIDSLYGHDGFLIETEKINSIIKKFYQS
jgi:homoserine O-acetyltransferase